MALLEIYNLKSKIKAKLYLMSVMIVKNTREKGTYNHILFQTLDLDRRDFFSRVSDLDTNFGRKLSREYQYTNFE